MKTEFLRRNYNFEIRAEKKDGEENKGKYTLYGLPIVFVEYTQNGLRAKIYCNDNEYFTDKPIEDSEEDQTT